MSGVRRGWYAYRTVLAAHSGHRGHERQRDEQEHDRAGSDADARPVAAPALPPRVSVAELSSSRRRRGARGRAAPSRGARWREPRELDLPAEGAQRALPYGEKASGMTAHARAGPASSSMDAVHGKAREEPAEAGEAEQRPSAARSRRARRGCAAHAPRDPSRECDRRARDRARPAAAGSRSSPGAARKRAKPATRASAAGTSTSADQGSSLATAAWKVAPPATSCASTAEVSMPTP